jgi:integrase
MPYARKDGNKRWVADVRYARADGVELRLHRTYDTKEEATRAEAWFKLTGDLLPGTAVPAHAFSTVAARFKERNPDWFSGNTGRMNSQRFEACLSYFGNHDIKAVRFAQIEDFIAFMRTKRPVPKGRMTAPPADATVRHYVSALFKVLDYALGHELIPGLPKRPKISKKGHMRDALTLAQEDGIVDRMEPLSAFYTRLLAATGMRCGEVDKLRADQIEIPQEQPEYTGLMLQAEQTKTKAARWVPVMPEMARRLKVLLASNSMPTRAHVYGQFKRAVESRGDDNKLTLHCLRHTTNTRLLQSGAHPTDVAKIMGHSTMPGTTEMQLRYYHPDKAHLFSVVEKMLGSRGDRPTSADVLPLIPKEKSA